MLNREQQKLFESKISPEPISGCWLWTAGGNNYPQFAINRRLQGAHRVSYKLYKGKIPDGLLVCHSCDVPFCVNPAHLFLGTGIDNQQDSIKKGRTAYLKGTHPKIKIKDVEKQDICTLGWLGWPQTKIAKALGLANRTSIKKILVQHGIPLHKIGVR